MVRLTRSWAFAALLTITAPSVVAAQSSPTNLYPANGQTGVSPSPTLEIDCSPTGRTAAKYEISTDPAFSSPASLAYAPPENINDLCSHVAATNLNSLVTYYWRAAVRNTQGIWSPWSTPTTFTTIDAATVYTNLFQDGTLAYSGTRDADIRGRFLSPGQVPPREWNQGRQDVLRTGRRAAEEDETFRSLLKFDLAPHLTNPQAVVNAYIELTGWQHSDPAFFTAPNTLYEVYRPWGEGRGLAEQAPQPGEVSWTYSMLPDAWAIRGAASASDTDPNADRAATRLVTLAPTNQPGFVTRWSSQELVEAVKRWIAQPESNQGVLLRADDESSKRLLHIASREHNDPSFRPLLVIESTERAARPPAPQDDVASTVEGMPVDIGVLVNDVDPEPGPGALAITGIGTPTHGVTQLVGTLVRYTPNPGFVGTDSFGYTVSDGVRSGTATVSVEVGSTGDGVRVWLEAETGTLTPPMAINPSWIDTNGASWGQYILVPNGAGNVSDGSSPGGQATYTFSVPAGTYAVWGRVSAPTSADNTFWVSMDGGPFTRWTLPLSTAWTWDRVNSDSADPLLFSWPAAGPHTLVIKQSEDGARLDRLLITSNLAFVPEIILDNASVGVRDAERTFTGTWCVSTASGFFGDNSLYNCGGSGDSYQWIPNLPNAASYDVYAWWTAHANRSTSVPITVFHAGGATTFTVNQRINGGTWRLLGRFPFNAGTAGYVEVSGAGGQAAADAVRWVLAPQAQDAAPPNTTITGGPTGTLAASTATMTWSGVDDMTAASNLVYAYRLDPLEPSFSAFGPATTKSYANLANGAYTFHVKARDQAGNEDASPATQSFTVSVTAGEIVLDGAPVGVQDSGRTFTGTWCTSTSSGSFGSESLYSCGAGIDTYRWIATIPTAGTYDVYIWWTAHVNRSTTVPITVNHAGGSTTQTFNQRVNGGQWIRLGTFSFNAGVSGYVEVSDVNGQAAADAVRWVPAVADATAPDTTITAGPTGTITTSSASMSWTGADDVTPATNLVYAYRLEPLEADFSAFGSSITTSYASLPNGSYTFHVKARDLAGNEDATPATRGFVVNVPQGEIILDNALAGVADSTRAFTGTWCVSASTGQFGSESLYSCGAGTDRYRWTPAIPTAGTYQVYVWWTAHANRSTNVPITVVHAGGSATQTFNQRLSGGQWVSLGTYGFDAGSGGYVEVTNANGQAAADAVRWVPATPDGTAPDTSITGGPSGVITTSSATMTWTGTDDATVTANLQYAYRLHPLESSFSAFGAATSRSYANLANGTYTFHVKARDQVGNEDQSPDTRTFTVSAAEGEIVVDNAAVGVQDARRTFAGVWCVSSSAGFFGSESLYNCGSSADRYRWTPNLVNAGSYEVYIWWTAHPNRSTNVPITVAHANGSTTQLVNQRINGGQWVSLGVFTFNGSIDEYVEVSSANGQVAADAVRWVPASGTIILDNAAVGVQDGARAFTGTWCVSTSSGSFGPNSLYSCGGGLDTYRWAADIPASGNYTVYAWWTSHPNRSTTVDVTIVHANGSTTQTVNQQINGGQWVSLGTFFFNAGPAAGSVEVNDANGQAAADAVRWVATPP